MTRKRLLQCGYCFVGIRSNARFGLIDYGLGNDVRYGFCNEECLVRWAKVQADEFHRYHEHRIIADEEL